MPPTIDPAKRGATLPSDPHEGPVTLINSFVVDPRRDEAFEALWTQTSVYFRGQPGFVGAASAPSSVARWNLSLRQCRGLGICSAVRRGPRDRRIPASRWPTGLA